MYDQPDIGLVDAHPEGDGRHDNRDLVTNELLLGLAAYRRIQTGVVGQGGQTPLAQRSGQVLGALARKAVHDAGLAPVLVQQVRQRINGVALGTHAIAQIGAVEAGQELLGPGQFKLFGNIVADLFGCRSGQGDTRYTGQGVPQGDEIAVIGPELVAPHGDAVRLVHGHQADRAFGQEIQEAGHGQPLRGNVQDFDRIPLYLPAHVVQFRVGQAAVDELRGNAVGLERIDLVFHQRDQR